MPELPEVETIKRALSSSIIGQTITDIEIRKPKIFRGNTADVVGKKVIDIARRGKVLIIKLEGGKDLFLHFKLTGQIVWVPEAGEKVTLGHPIPFAGEELPAKTTHVILRINGGKLFYNDLRQFGWIKVVDESNPEELMDISKLGPEPLDKEFDFDYLKKIFSKTSKPIKIVLMDQEKIAGVGNIYANDALFEAGIMPTRPAKTLSDEEINKLREATIKVINEGIEYGGSSARDESYIKPSGEKGSYQNHFRVYQRKGEKCPKCGSVIERINQGGRGTFFCRTCQK